MIRSAALIAAVSLSAAGLGLTAAAASALPTADAAATTLAMGPGPYWCGAPQTTPKVQVTDEDKTDATDAPGQPQCEKVADRTSRA